MSEFRTGYNEINKYRHQIGQSLTPYFESGGEENTKHFLLNRTRYHQEREEIKRQL